MINKTNRKGIILAGGLGTRMMPLSESISKQLLPIYNKPLIFYPLSTLMLAGIKDILIISTPHDLALFEKLLGDGSKYGINISYEIQDQPNGIAEAFLIAENFLDSSPCALILGDNIFYGDKLHEILTIQTNDDTSTVFAYHVHDPIRYGVAEFDGDGAIIGIEEKPMKPKSNYALTGLYFYDDTVVERAKKLQPSTRGELEITDLNMSYLNDSCLNCIKLNRGFAWLDAGTLIQC